MLSRINLIMDLQLSVDNIHRTENLRQRLLLRQKSSRVESGECFCSDPTDIESTIRLSCLCLVHRKCLVSYLRNGMEDRLALIGTMRRMKQVGFLCPYAGAHTCAAASGGISDGSGFINIDDLETLLLTADRNDGAVSSEDALSSNEIQKLQEWIAEDMPLGTAPLVASISAKNRSALTANGINSKISGDLDQIESTDVFIAATTKACPKCKFSITHWHGHSCHHISPAGGCPKCKEGFCYKCLQSASTNQQLRGAASKCLCNGWSNFCLESEIRSNINVLPYPHDKRCGCCFCPDCRVGSPCGTCSGHCVVCKGIVPPGPIELDPKWNFDMTQQPQSPPNTRASLFDACRDGNVQRIVEIMDSPNVTFDINIRDNIQRTPLFYAIDSGNVNCVSLLLTVYHADTLITDSSGNTPLHHAIEIVNEDITRAILEASPNVNVNIENNDHITPLLIAVNHSSLALTQLLLDCGANSRIVDRGSGASLLHIASRNGCYQLCRLFTSNTSHHLAVDTFDKHGKSPLHCAAESGNVDVARLLVAEKAARSSKSQVSNYVMTADKHGRIPLHYALLKGKPLMTDYLISLDPERSVYITTGMGTKTTLMYAVESGNIDTVRALLNGRNQIPVEIKQKGLLGMIGVGNPHMKTEKQFMDMKSMFGRSAESAISRAWRDCHYDIVAFLFERGAELFIPADRLLHECCKKDPPPVPIIRSLLRSGKIKDSDLLLPNGKNLLYTTCFHPETFGLLLEYSTLPVDGPNREETVTWKIVSMMMREAPRTNHVRVDPFADFFSRLFTGRGAATPVQAPTDYIDRNTCIQSFHQVLRFRGLRIADYSTTEVERTAHPYPTIFHFAVSNDLVGLFRIVLENDLPNFGMAPELEKTMLTLIYSYDMSALYRILVEDFGNYFRFGRRPHDDQHLFLLHDACAAGAPRIVEFLIERGANVNEIRLESNQERPIHCVKDSVAIVQLLVRNGASLRVKDGNGRLPLHRAAMDGHANVLKHYLQKCRRNFIARMLHMKPAENAIFFADTDIFARDNAGNTPLSLARRYGRGNVAKIVETEILTMCSGWVILGMVVFSSFIVLFYPVQVFLFLLTLIRTVFRYLLWFLYNLMGLGSIISLIAYILRININRRGEVNPIFLSLCTIYASFYIWKFFK